MLSIDVKLSVINKYFVDGKGYKRIAKELYLSRDTVRSFIIRYKRQKGIPFDSRGGIINRPLSKEDLLPCMKTPEIDINKRIADLEMQVELLRNFLVLGEGR